MKTISSSSDTAWAGLSCILVAQNDQGNVAPAVAALTRALAGQRGAQIGDYEIILVDDGSSDLTGTEALHLQETDRHVRVVRHTEPQGFGAAFYSGFIVARYPLIFLSTADNRFDYGQIVAFLSYAQEYDVVVGFRPDRQDPLLRKAASAVWNFLVTLLFGWRLRDIDCTFKLFHREALTQADLVHLCSRGAIIHTELLTLFKREKMRILEAPVTHFPGSRDITPGITPRVVLRALWKILGLRVRLTVQAILGYLGFITGMFSRTSRPMEVMVYRRSTRPGKGIIGGCRLCGADVDSLRLTKLHPNSHLNISEPYRLIYCSNCHNAFTAPLPPPEEHLLKADVPDERLNVIQRFLLRWFSVQRTSRVLQLLSPVDAPCVLDVGGGNCRFANSLARSGCQVTVVEPNVASEVHADKRAGVRFVGARFSSRLIDDQILLENSFDCITMWHSLEHISNLTDALLTARRLLKLDGILYISTPNLNSLQADLGGNYWAYLDIPYQLSLLTPEGLLRLLKNNGFARFRLFFFSVEYDVFGYYQTIINLLSHSHNYYYLLRASQKGFDESRLRFPLWTRLVTLTGIIWLGPAFLLAWAAGAMGKQACIELACCPEQEESASEVFREGK